MKNSSRIIKFRAWDKKHKNMLFNVSTGTIVIWSSPDNRSADAEDCIFMQYTGLKDENGKEVYEGDILKNTKNKNQLVEVYWEGCTTDKHSINGGDWINWGGWSFKKVKIDDDFTYAIYQNEIEVIGNIYENPDLINPRKE